MNIIVRLVLVLVAGTSLFSCMPIKTSVEICVEEQLELHPKSELADLYKYFFQDRFGPGHLAPDSASAWRYLNYELDKASTYEDFDVQPLKYVGQFSRVNLRIVASGQVDKNEFQAIFLESGKNFKLPAVDQWAVEWAEILKEIDEMKLDLPNFQQDKSFIDSVLQSGKYAVHHSKTYIENYDPHYRIIATSALKSLNLSGD